MNFIYNIAIHLLTFGIAVVSGWNSKARLAKKGRKIDYASSNLDEPIWFHCASLGEFEQARPVIEKIKSEHPQHQILLTFFSPSGYESKSDYVYADHVMYLPFDTPRKAKKFIHHFKPKMAIFVKYELWFNLIREMKSIDKPVYLLSATFRPQHRYFKWYGGFFRQMLTMLDHIFVQDERSLKLLETIDIKHAKMSGDTRYDRVSELSTTDFSDPLIEKFCDGDCPVLVVGSSWAHEEVLLQSVWSKYDGQLKLIIAPHDISSTRIGSIENRFKNTHCYSGGLENLKDQNILIIDNIGLLSKLYRYGNLAFVGGGFYDSLHNILEPASYGLPVCFGPKTDRFHEAKDMIKNGEARSVKDGVELSNFIDTFKNSNGYENRRFILERTGASDEFTQHIEDEL